MKTKSKKETSECIKSNLDSISKLNKNRKSALDKMSKSLEEDKLKTKNL